MTPAPAAPRGEAPAGSLAPFGALFCAYFAAVGMFNPYAPLWFQSLGFSAIAIGGIAALQAWTRVIAPYGWGWLGDHGGRRARLVAIAAAITFTGALVLPATSSYPAIAAAVVLIFMANGGIVPLAEALLARRVVAAGVLDSARYGRTRMWGSVGFIVSVTAFGAVLEASGVAAFPWFAMPMFGLLLLAALRLPEAPRALTAEGPAPAAWPVLRRPEVAWLFASIFFHVLAHTSLYVFFSLHLDAEGFGKPVLGMLWAVAVAIEIAFFALQGRVMPRLPATAWLALCGAVAVGRFVLTAAFGGVLVVLVLAQALHAITFAAHHSACIELLNRHFGGALRGRGQALYTAIGYGASGVIGGLAGGWLVEQAGFASVFWAAAVAAALGTGCAWRAGRATNHRN